MYRVLGWINVAAVVLILLPFVLNFIAKKLFKAKDGPLIKIARMVRKYHKVLGGIVLAVTLVHGFLALGSFALHTGTIVGIMVVVTALVGLLFYVVKNKTVFKLHIALAIAFVALLIIHLLFPSILYALAT